MQLYDLTTPLDPQKTGWAQIPGQSVELTPGANMQVLATNPFTGIFAITGYPTAVSLPVILR